MKDTIITTKTKKRELYLLLLSFILAFLLNIISIVIYHTQWKELLTMFHVTLILTVIIYLIILLIRLFIRGIARLFGRKLHI